MAPMTRSRASAGNVPGDLAVTYYRQRAGAGLIVAEGTQPSAAGQGYVWTPGLHDGAQEAAAASPIRSSSRMADCRPRS